MSKQPAPFSPSTLGMFRELLTSVQLPITHPNFPQLAEQAATAIRELDAAQAALDEPPAPPAPTT